METVLFLPKWRMIDREMENDLRTAPVDRKVSVVDYGSTFGFFSVHIAQKFEEGSVISLEGQEFKENEGGADLHLQLMKDKHINNNVLCRAMANPKIFTQFYQAEMAFTYQLSLGTFHWVLQMDTREDFDNALGHHLMNARTTFLELPEAMVYNGREGQINWQQINVWYDGRNNTQILEDLAKKFDIKINYKFLGPILHSSGTIRNVYRVDLPDIEPYMEIDKALEIYECKQIYGGENMGILPKP